MKFNIRCYLLGFILTFSTGVNAIPLYLTFDGSLAGYGNTNGITDNVYLEQTFGLSIGTSLSYTVMVDIDSPTGSRIRNDGTVQTLVDESLPRFSVDYFSASYVSGSPIESLEYTDNFSLEANYGQFFYPTIPGQRNSTSLNVGDLLRISSIGIGFEVGQSFGGLDYYSRIPDSSNRSLPFYYRAATTLTSICDRSGTNCISSLGPVSVPEPSTLLLFGLGLTGLIVVRRKRYIN